MALQNGAVVSVDCFLELHGFYSESMFVVLEGTFFAQKNGIRIGVGVAAVLSDILLA